MKGLSLNSLNNYQIYAVVSTDYANYDNRLEFVTTGINLINNDMIKSNIYDDDPNDVVIIYNNREYRIIDIFTLFKPDIDDFLSKTTYYD